MTSHDLIGKLNDIPFKTFRLKLSNATPIDVREPGSVILGDSSAVLPVETYVDEQGYWNHPGLKTIAFEHVVEFCDLHDRSSGPKRRKK